jgi:PAS domain S-box-containing protein
MEAWPRMPDGKPRLVLVAGQPIEVGDAECMLFTFADLEPRRWAEVSLLQNEKLFEKAFRMAPVPMAVADLEDWFRFILVNEAFVDTMGHAEAEAVGRTAAELGLWDDPGAAADLEGRLRETRTVRDVEVRLRGRRGGAMDCLLSAEGWRSTGVPARCGRCRTSLTGGVRKRRWRPPSKR